MRKLFIKLVLIHLKFWAKVTLLVHKPYVIGIAGSVGKSSTRNALHAVLKDHFKVKVVSGNSETGVPIGILGLKLPAYENKEWLKVMIKAPTRIFNLKKTDYLIVEMGIDDPFPPKNMEYLLSIVKPTMAIDLNVTATHTMQFEKLLNKNVKNPMDFLLTKIAEEDSKIITRSKCKVAIYNGNDEYLVKILSQQKINSKVLLFGDDKECDLRLGEYEISTKRTKFSFKAMGRKGEMDIFLSFPGILLPPAYKETLASVLLACHELGLKYSQIKESLEKNFKLPAGRSSIFEGYKNSILIDSSYNSSKESVLSFLEMLKTLKKKTGRRVVFVMGDMRELGNQAEEEHKEIAEKATYIVDEIYCVGPLTNEYVVPTIKQKINERKGSIKKIEWYKNAVQLALHLKEEIQEDSIVLFKGSQNEVFLEEAVKFLLSKEQDSKFLARQDAYWLRVKQSFFSI